MASSGEVREYNQLNTSLPERVGEFMVTTKLVKKKKEKQKACV